MVGTLKLVLYENNKEIERIETETRTEPAELLMSLEVFRQTVNETLTKKIKDDVLTDDHEEEDVSDSEEEEEKIQHRSPKKRKV